MVPKLPGICFTLLLPIFSFGCSELVGTVGQSRPDDPSASRRAGDPSLTTNSRSLTPGLLTPSSKTIDLGIVAQAGREQETFALENPGSEPVEITQFETSCECLEIHLLRPAIAPSEKVLAQATLDLGKEPQFVGGLAVEVKGLTRSGAVAFNLVVTVTVRPAKDFEPREDPL